MKDKVIGTLIIVSKLAGEREKGKLIQLTRVIFEAQPNVKNVDHVQYPLVLAKLSRPRTPSFHYAVDHTVNLWKNENQNRLIRSQEGISK